MGAPLGYPQQQNYWTPPMPYATAQANAWAPPGGGGAMPGMPGAAGPQPVRGLVMKPDPNNPNSPGTVWDTGSGGGMGFFTKLLIAGLFIGGGVLAFKKWGNAEMVGKATTFIKDHTPQKLKDLYQAAAKKIGSIFGKAEKAAEKAAT